MKPRKQEERKEGTNMSLFPYSACLYPPVANIPWNLIYESSYMTQTEMGIGGPLQLAPCSLSSCHTPVLSTAQKMSACPGGTIQCCSAHICPCVASSACHHVLFKHVLKTWLFVLKPITMVPEFINSIIHLCGIFKISMHYCPFFFFGLQNEAQLSRVLILSQTGSFRVLTIKQHSTLSGQTLIDFSSKRSLFLRRSPQYLKLCNQNCRALKSISHHLGKVPFKRLAWHHIGILWQREEQNPVLRGTFQLTALSIEPFFPQSSPLPYPHPQHLQVTVLQTTTSFSTAWSCSRARSLPAPE